jgi:hypothetical protein
MLEGVLKAWQEGLPAYGAFLLRKKVEDLVKIIAKMMNLIKEFGCSLIIEITFVPKSVEKWSSFVGNLPPSYGIIWSLAWLRSHHEFMPYVSMESFFDERLEMGKEQPPCVLVISLWRMSSYEDKSSYRHMFSKGLLKTKDSLK